MLRHRGDDSLRLVPSSICQIFNRRICQIFARRRHRCRRMRIFWPGMGGTGAHGLLIDIGDRCVVRASGPVYLAICAWAHTGRVMSMRCEASSASLPIAAAKALWASSLRRQLADTYRLSMGTARPWPRQRNRPTAEPLTYNADAILIGSAVTHARASFRKDTNGEEEQHEAVGDEKRREEVLYPQGCIVAEDEQAGCEQEGSEEDELLGWHDDPGRQGRRSGGARRRSRGRDGRDQGSDHGRRKSNRTYAERRSGGRRHVWARRAALTTSPPAATRSQEAMTFRVPLRRSC
jgi:hypothetical protein